MNEDQLAAEQIMQQFTSGKALRPPANPNKIVINARISKDAQQGLRLLAEHFGYTWNGQGNISLLLEAIGTNTIRIDTRTY